MAPVLFGIFSFSSVVEGNLYNFPLLFWFPRCILMSSIFVQYAHRKCVQHWCNEKGDITCEICHQVCFLLFSFIYLYV